MLNKQFRKQIYGVQRKERATENEILLKDLRTG